MCVKTLYPFVLLRSMFNCLQGRSDWITQVLWIYPWSIINDLATFNFLFVQVFHLVWQSSYKHLFCGKKIHILKSNYGAQEFCTWTCHLHDPGSKWNCLYRSSSGPRCWSKDLLSWERCEVFSSPSVLHSGRSQQKERCLWSSTPAVLSHLQEKAKRHSFTVIYYLLSNKTCLYHYWSPDIKGIDTTFILTFAEVSSPVSDSTQRPLASRTGSSRSVSYWMSV